MDLTQILPYLPYAGLVVMVAVLLLGGRSANSERAAPPAGAILTLATFVAIAIAAAWNWQDKAPGALEGAISFGIGALAAVVADFLERFMGEGIGARSLPLAVAAVAVAACNQWLAGGVLGTIFGAAAGAWMLRVNRPSETGGVFLVAVSAAAIAAANYLGGQGDAPVQGAGTIYALLAVVALLIASQFDRKEKGASPVQIIVAAALLAGVAWVGAEQLLAGKGSMIPLAGGALAALIVVWLVAPDTGIRYGIAALIWLAGATAAFSVEAGYGMAVAWIGAVAIFTALDRRAGVLTLGPLAALTLYRMLREAHAPSGLAFDINQHYAMIGVLAGALTPLLMLEWLLATGTNPRVPRFVAGALWIVAMCFIPPLAAILLGVKGMSGFLIGTGIAPVVAALKAEKNGQALSLSIGICALTLAAFTWLEPLLELTREEKLHALGITGGALIVVACIIGLLSWGVSRKESVA